MLIYSNSGILGIYFVLFILEFCLSLGTMSIIINGLKFKYIKTLRNLISGIMIYSNLFVTLN